MSYNLLALDPGVTTGYAVISVETKKPKLINVGECKDLLLLELEHLFEECDIIIYEDFLIDPNKSRAGSFDRSRMETIQTIGVIRLWASLKNKKAIPQLNNIKPVGYGYANLPYKKGARGVHQFDAIAHGMYYLVKKELALPLR